MSTRAAIEQPPEQHVSERRLYSQIIKASLTYSIAGFAPLAIGMIMLPIYTRFLRPSDYGLLELLDATRTVFSMLVGARYTESLLFFYGRAKTRADQESTVSTVIWGSLLLAAVATLLGWIYAPMLAAFVLQQSADVLDLRIVLLTFGLSLPIEASMAWLRALDLAREYLLLSLVRLLLSLGAAVVCLNIFSDKVQGVLVGNLLVTAMIMVYLMARFVTTHTGRFEWPRFVVQLRFGFLLTATGAAVFVIHFGDRFFLQRYTSLAEVGLYGLAYKCGMVVSVVQAAFSQYWGAQMYQVLATTEGLQRFRRIHTYLILTLSYVAILVSGSAGPIFHVFVPSAYRAAAAYVPWIALTYVVRAHGDYFRSALYVEGMPGTDTAINTVASVICVLLYRLLIPRYGPYGAVLATVITFGAVSTFARARVVRKRGYSIDLWRSGTGFALAICCGLIFVHSQIRSFSFQIFVLATTMVGFPFVLYVTRVLALDERRFIRSIPSRLRTITAQRFA